MLKMSLIDKYRNNIARKLSELSKNILPSISSKSVPTILAFPPFIDALPAIRGELTVPPREKLHEPTVRSIPFPLILMSSSDIKFKFKFTSLDHSGREDVIFPKDVLWIEPMVTANPETYTVPSKLNVPDVPLRPTAPFNVPETPYLSISNPFNVTVRSAFSLS